MPNVADEAKTPALDLGELVRRRYRKRLNQGELAELAGISRAQMSKIESGKEAGSPAARGRIADALGCTVEDLERKPARRRAAS